MSNIDNKELLDKLDEITSKPSMKIVWHRVYESAKPYAITITYKINWRSRLELYFHIDDRYILNTVTVQGFFRGYTIPVEEVDSGLLVSRLVKEVSIARDRINKDTIARKHYAEIDRVKNVKSLLGLRK